MADTAASPDSVAPESSGSPQRVTPSSGSPSRVMSDTFMALSLRIVEDVTCDANNNNCKDVSNRHHTTTMHHHHHQSTASGRDGIPLEDFYRDGTGSDTNGTGRDWILKIYVGTGRVRNFSGWDGTGWEF